MSPESAAPEPPRIEGTVRVVRSGLLADLSEDPVERYQHHFVHIVERNLDRYEQPINALDLSCGTGGSTLTIHRRLPKGSRIVALSEDRAQLRVFHEQLSRELRRVVFPRKHLRTRLPFAPGVFDLVWAALAREQLQPARPVIRAALRVLRPGGLLLIAAPLRATFAELATALGPSLKGHEHDPVFHALIEQPPELVDADSWREDMIKSGAVEAEVRRDTIELTLSPPLSNQRLFAEQLLPLWLGKNTELKETALKLLDVTVKNPITVPMHVGCVRGRRGASDLEASSIA